MYFQLILGSQNKITTSTTTTTKNTDLYWIIHTNVRFTHTFNWKGNNYIQLKLTTRYNNGENQQKEKERLYMHIICHMPLDIYDKVVEYQYLYLSHTGIAINRNKTIRTKLNVLHNKTRLLSRRAQMSIIRPLVSFLKWFFIYLFVFIVEYFFLWPPKRPFSIGRVRSFVKFSIR